jgi:hypothetical protein
LIQPENSRRKKASGGGSGSMAGACLSAERRSTGGEIGRRAPAHWAEIPEASFPARLRLSSVA